MAHGSESVWAKPTTLRRNVSYCCMALLEGERYVCNRKYLEGQCGPSYSFMGGMCFQSFSHNQVLRLFDSTVVEMVAAGQLDSWKALKR